MWVGCFLQLGEEEIKKTILPLVVKSHNHVNHMKEASIASAQESTPCKKLTTTKSKNDSRNSFCSCLPSFSIIVKVKSKAQVVVETIILPHENKRGHRSSQTQACPLSRFRFLYTLH